MFIWLSLLFLFSINENWQVNNTSSDALICLQIESDQLKQYVVEGWSEQVVDKEKVSLTQGHKENKS